MSWNEQRKKGVEEKGFVSLPQSFPFKNAYNSQHFSFRIRTLHKSLSSNAKNKLLFISTKNFISVL